MAYGYQPVSPYSYCMGNPINFVDPDGEDVWEMDYKGRVKWVSPSQEHVMYALDKDGNRTGQSITIKDRTIFDDLAATGKASDYTASYTIGNPTELASVFLFGADNSKAEWTFSRFNNGNGDQYAVGTIHKDDLAIRPDHMGYEREDEIAFIHSHPSPLPQTKAEYGSIGWSQYSAPSYRSDSYNVAHYSERYPVYKNSYVYFPRTGNIYHVRGNPYPAFIRNIKNHKYDGMRIFWGTLNGK